MHRFRLVLLFCCNSLFAQIEKEKTFTDINITEAYGEMKNSFSEGYYMPQSIKTMENITQILDNEESEIYGYKTLKVQWENTKEVKINLEAFDNGEKICTYRSYEISLKQTGKDTRGIIESKMLYPQDIETYIQTDMIKKRLIDKWITIANLYRKPKVIFSINSHSPFLIINASRQ